MIVFFFLRASVCNCKVYEVQAEWLWWRFIILTPRFWKATKPKETSRWKEFHVLTGGGGEGFVTAQKQDSSFNQAEK